MHPMVRAEHGWTPNAFVNNGADQQTRSEQEQSGPKSPLSPSFAQKKRRTTLEMTTHRDVSANSHAAPTHAT